FAHSNQSSCAADARCKWESAVGLCVVHCEGITNAAECTASLCEHNATTNACTSEYPSVVPGIAVARALSDGGELQLLHYGAANAFRFDPDGAIPAGALPNTSQDARQAGMEFLSSMDAVAM